MNISGVCLHKILLGGTTVFTIQMFHLNNASVNPVHWHIDGLTLLYPFYIVKN